MNRSEIIDELSLWAERYAISRASYASQSTCRALLTAAKAGYLTDKTMRTMITDIDAAMEHGTIPFDDQVRDWGKLKETLSYQLNPKEYM